MIQGGFLVASRLFGRGRNLLRKFIIWMIKATALRHRGLDPFT